ncbi:MAG: hypothetical protein ACFE9S_01385 [Candidatus Hermodarchaeota archaeon]
MVSEEVLEEKSTPLFYPHETETEEKKKGRLRKFFSNDDVVIVLFSLGVGAIMITLLVIAGILGVSFPASAWWY